MPTIDVGHQYRVGNRRNMEEGIFNTELGKKILALVKASFKVSDMISDLVLREKIKNHILNFYKLFFSVNGSKNHLELVKEIDDLDSLFYLAGHLNLVKEENIKILRNGFLVFKSCFILSASNATIGGTNNSQNKTVPITTKVVKIIPEKNTDNLNPKQKKIMERFETKDILRLSEIMELFPNFSERTIRNDLAALIKSGKITRNGKGNGSFYKILQQ